MVLLHDITLTHQHALELKRAVEEQAENMRHIRKSRDVYLEQATRDAVTGSLNRRSLDASFSAMKEQALSRGGPLTTAMVDLDDFKTINDRFGHANGDRALQPSPTG